MTQEVLIPRVYTTFFRFCKKCECRFKPNSKYAKLCDICYIKTKKDRTKKLIRRNIERRLKNKK